MTMIERPGANPKWVKKLKKYLKEREAWYEVSLTDNQAPVAEYVKTGLPWNLEENPLWEGEPPYRRYRSLLQHLAFHYLFSLESQALAGDSPHFDTTAAMRSFAVYRLAWLIEVQAGKHWTGDTEIVALGVVLGCRAQTDAMVRRGLNWVRPRLSEYEEDELISVNLDLFRYALLADFLGEAPLYPAGRESRQPILAALLKQWRDPDPAAIASLCLGVCDLETHAQFDGAIQPHYAFPIDVLLLFRLRQWLGLENPVLDHPIMNTPLGQLPEETPFAYDELQQGFYNHMVEAGFDEATVLANDPDLQGTRT